MAKRPSKAAPPTKQQRPFKKKKGPKAAPAPVPAYDDTQVDDVEVSDEDIAFVQQAKKRLTFLEKFDADTAAKHTRVLKEQNKVPAAVPPAKETKSGRQGKEDEEEDVADYERVPRTTAKDKGPVSHGLPTKALDGELIPATEKPTQPKKFSAALVNVVGVEVEDALEQKEQKQQDANKEQEQKKGSKNQKGQKEAGPKGAEQKGPEDEEDDRDVEQQKKKMAADRIKSLPPVLAALHKIDNVQKRREAAQQAMAVAAHKLLENPNENVAELKVLNGLISDADSIVGRLAMVTMTTVMKDILPGYRIRLPTAEELKVKVTKEVQRVRDFEAALLSAYQVFLKGLQGAANTKAAANGVAGPPIQHTRVALKCMCSLLCSLPHFNYTSDILQLVVPRMASRDPEMCQMACTAVAETIRNDEQGRLSREVVQLVADLVKRRKCVCPPLIVQSLFGLDFSEVQVEVDDGEGKGSKRKKPKKGRKRKKNEDEVDAAFKEAHAGPDKEEQALLQSETLEALFEMLFRILKQAVACASRIPADQVWTREDMDKKCPMLGISLQAISRYMYLTSVEYFNDLLEVIKELARCPALPLEERLGCLLTATSILRGQGEALSVDQRQFYLQLYELLVETPLNRVSENDDGLEGIHVGSTPAQHPSTTAQHPPPPALQNGTANGRAAHDPSSNGPLTEPVILAQLCHKMLCEVKMTDMGRLAAFLKRLSSMSLHLTAGYAMGLLAVAFRLLQRYPKMLNLLEWEGEAAVGGRSFDPNIPDPSEAGALATCLWDLNLLQKHYHPDVRQAAAALLSLSPGSTTHPSGPLTTAKTPDQLASLYSSTKGLFHPAPKPPGKQPKSRQLRIKDDNTFLTKELAQQNQTVGQVQLEEEELEDRLRQHFRLNRCYDRNRQLRREHQRVTGMLQRLKQTLQQYQMG